MCRSRGWVNSVLPELKSEVAYILLFDTFILYCYVKYIAMSCSIVTTR